MSLIHVKGIDTDGLGNRQSEGTFDCYINPTEIKAIVVEGDIGYIAFIHGGDMAIERKSVDSSEIVIKTDETFKTIDGEESRNAVFPLLQCLTSIYAIREYQMANSKKQHSEEKGEDKHE